MRSIIIICVLFLFYACDKQAKTSKRLIGEWEVVSHKITAGEFLSYYGDPQGTLSISRFENDKSINRFEWSTMTQSSIGTISFSNNGIIEVVEKGDYFDAIYMDASQTPLDTVNMRVYTMTNEDLSLEFVDSEFRLHFFVFKKK
jgi:hypothetical protein